MQTNYSFIKPLNPKHNKHKHPTHGNNKLSPLFLVLDPQAPATYTSGDRVRGVARVDPALRPQRVRLVFKGHERITIRNRGQGRDKMIDEVFSTGEPEFFFYSQELYMAPVAEPSFDIVAKGTAADGKVELPFEFIFPRNVELPPPPPAEMWGGRPQFSHAPGDPLPPTYKSPIDTMAQQYIEYFLEGELFSSSAEKSDVMVRQYLKFMPPAPVTPLHVAQSHERKPNPSYYKYIRSFKLNPGYDGGGSLKRMKDSLSKHKAPYAKFNLFASIPLKAVVGCNLPITFALQHLDRSEEIVDPPPVFVRRIRIQLYYDLHIRMCFPKVGLSGGESLDGKRENIKLFDKRFETGDGEPLYDGIQLSDLGDAKLPKDLVPSFKSYGLAHDYRIMVEIWGECGKEKFEGLAANETLEVVSNITTVENAEIVALAALESTEEPPPYQA